MLWTSVALLIAAFIVLEMCARWRIRFRRAYYVLPPGLRLRLHNDRETFPELEPVVRFEVNADGERGPEVPRFARGDRLYRVPGPEAPLHNIVFTPAPDDLVAGLKQRGVSAVRQYRTLSQHPAYRELADRRFSGADYWTDRAVYLPFGMSLQPDDAARIADAVVASGVALDVLDS